jgi:phosphoglycolate phosphatase
MKKLVIFDFDGVLVDTIGIGFSINQEIHEDLSLEEYKSFFEGNIYGALRKDGTPKKYHPDFFNLYDSKAREIIVPDILKLAVKELSNLYTLVIISSTHSESIKKILEREEISKYFTEFLGADVEKNKVIKINLTLNKYNILPKDAIFITDTIGDIKEGKECGVNSIAVTWGFHDKKTLEKGNPVAIIDDPRDLLKTIESVLE